jgi:hypothetical protein
MATDIPARRRQHMIQQWMNNQYGTTPPTNISSKHNQESTNQDHHRNINSTYYGGGYTFIATPTHISGKPVTTVAFQARAISQLPLEVSPALPHCEFPIGPAEGQGKLKVALDSCAGVHIGHLRFHRAMAEIFPELVANFKTMAEYGEDNITIGGVEASAAGSLE